MTTTAPEALRTIRKRNHAPKKSRTELAQEFDDLPLSAFASSPHVAAFLGCSEAKLERDRWIGSGIPYLKVGRSVRYKKSDVLSYLDGKTLISTTQRAV